MYSKNNTIIDINDNNTIKENRTNDQVTLAIIITFVVV